MSAAAKEADLSGLPQPGELFEGKYRIVRVVGVGGMGVVLEAHHMHLDQRVAIKMLLPECAVDGYLVQRFVREGRAAVRIRSAHIARVQDVGTTREGLPFLVMEYLEGADLETILEQRGPLPIALAVDLLLQTGEALAHAHAQGIVHRDLKPQNLFLTASAGKESAKLLDFGISKLPAGSPTDLAMTKTRAALGTPLYMAPEQMRSAHDADARTDIWGLGTLLFAMLTGKTPFAGSTMPELCASILQDPAPRLCDLRTGVPAEIGDAVQRCLEKDPAMRFSSVLEIARIVARFGSSRAPALLASIEEATAAGAREAQATASTATEITESPLTAPPLHARTGAAWGDTDCLPSPPRVRPWIWAAASAVGVTIAGIGVTRPWRSPTNRPVAAVAEASDSPPAVSPPLPAEPSTGEVALPTPPAGAPVGSTTPARTNARPPARGATHVARPPAVSATPVSTVSAVAPSNAGRPPAVDPNEIDMQRKE
jgi:serine/threonine protein kinase